MVYKECIFEYEATSHHATHPDHVRAAFRDHVIYAAVDQILTGLLSGDYAAMLASRIPATQAAADAGQLRRRITQADAAISGLMTELERLGTDTSPAAAAYRDRIRDQFTQRYDDKTAAQTELDALTVAQPSTEHPALLASAPEEIRAHVYAAFQVHALYRAQPHQATITDQTPAIIATLTADPRTDHDTANPERKDSPTAAIGA